MRWVWVGGLLAVLAACAGPPARPASVVPNPADGPGCLGVAAETCVRWLQATMRLDEGLIAASMARRHQVDVNGKPLGGGLITLSGKLPGRSETMVILIRLKPDDTVASVESSLLGDLITATTEQAYDRSAVYDMASRILGRRCPGMTKLDLYRFFENSVKPKIVVQRQDGSGGLSGLYRLTARAADVPYCGATFTFTHYIAGHGSAHKESGRNVSGFTSIELK